MNNFVIGFLFSYLTMTKDGKNLSKNIVNAIGKDVNNYLKKEGVIEKSRDIRPSGVDKPTVESKEQSVNKEPTCE